MDSNPTLGTEKPMSETVRPPVGAGRIESNLETQWNNWPSHRKRWEATSEHTWTFDVSAYAQATGLDIGGNYPRVPQEGGRTLAIVAEMHWHEREDGTSTVSVDETWYTNRSKNQTLTSYTADFDLNDEGHIRRVYVDGEPTVGDTDLLAWATEGTYVGTGRRFARIYHARRFTSQDPVRTVDGDLRRLIKADTPDDARRAEDYIRTDGQEPVAGD